MSWCPFSLRDIYRLSTNSSRMSSCLSRLGSHWCPTAHLTFRDYHLPQTKMACHSMSHPLNYCSYAVGSADSINGACAARSSAGSYILRLNSWSAVVSSSFASSLLSFYADRKEWTSLSALQPLDQLWSTLGGKKSGMPRIARFGLSFRRCCIRYSSVMDSGIESSFCCSCICPRFGFTVDSQSGNTSGTIRRCIFRPIQRKTRHYCCSSLLFWAASFCFSSHLPCCP